MLHDDVVAAQQGDPEAFARIVRSYASMVCSIAAAITHDVVLAEEVAQQVFVSAWSTLDRLRNSARLGAWLRQMTRNRAQDVLRQRHRRVEVPLEHDHLLVDSPEEAHTRAEEEAAVWSALASLPDNHREVLILFYREDRSVRQVAKLLELSESTVRKRLSRARERLRDDVRQRLGTFLIRTAPKAAFVVAVSAAITAIPRTAYAQHSMSAYRRVPLVSGLAIIPAAAIFFVTVCSPPSLMAEVVEEVASTSEMEVVEFPSEGLEKGSIEAQVQNRRDAFREDEDWKRCSVSMIEEDVQGSVELSQGNYRFLTRVKDSSIQYLPHWEGHIDPDQDITFRLSGRHKRYDIRLRWGDEQSCTILDHSSRPFYEETIRCPLMDGLSENIAREAAMINALMSRRSRSFRAPQQPEPAPLIRGGFQDGELIINGPPEGEGILRLSVGEGLSDYPVRWDDGECEPVRLSRSAVLNVEIATPGELEWCTLHGCGEVKNSRYRRFSVGIESRDEACAVSAICAVRGMTYSTDVVELTEIEPGDQIPITLRLEETALTSLDVRVEFIDEGFIVIKAPQDSVIEREGLLEGDIVTAVDGVSVFSSGLSPLLYLEPGGAVTLTVLRDGQVFEVSFLH